MQRKTILTASTATLALALSLAGCGDSSDDSGSGGGDGDWQKVTIKHAHGTTTIDEKPERVATVDFGNQEVPLALGIVPVGMSKMTWGDDNGDGVQPWTEEKLEELDADTPTLFDESDGYDFEAIAGTNPDVILAGYSGMSKGDYEKLSKIAPVVAYPDDPWATEWRDSIAINAKGLGKEKEGKKLIKDLEKTITESVDKHPEIKGKKAMYLTHLDPSDLSEINFYSAADTRSKYLEDLGLKIAPSVVKATKGNDFAGSMSGERVDELNDADIILTYGGEKMVKAMEDDPALSKLTAVENDAVVNLDGEKPIGTAGNPTPLSLPYLIDDYVELLAKAAGDTDAK